MGLRECIMYLNMMKGKFDRYCETGFYTLKFHLFDHIVEDIERAETWKTWMHRRSRYLMCTTKVHIVAYLSGRLLGSCKPIRWWMQRPKWQRIGKEINLQNSSWISKKGSQIERHFPYWARDRERSTLFVIPKLVVGGVIAHGKEVMEYGLLRIFQGATMRSSQSLCPEVAKSLWGAFIDENVKFTLLNSECVR